MSAQNIHRFDLVHFESRLTVEEPARGRASPTGISLWGGLSPQGFVGLSWPWAEVVPGVFAVRDPLQVRSNLLLLASDGSRLSASARAMVHMRLLADLPWQRNASTAARHPRRRSIDTMLVASPTQHLS
jgi:hypothetical protein